MQFAICNRLPIKLLLLSFCPFLALLLPAAKGEAPEAEPLLFYLKPIPADRVPLDRGVLVQLPIADFEERVRRARQAASPKGPPRLLEAHYRAVLKEGALHGTGQWKVASPDAGPTMLRLQPLNLALRPLRFENREALLADFDGQAPGLLLDEAGQRMVSVEWTARGDPSPGGLLFDLRVPPCAVATLELDLPADYALSVAPEGKVLVSGPHPADDEALRRWKVGFAGQSQLHLTARQMRGADRPPPLVLAGLQTTQQLNPDSVDAEFQFDLKALHQGVQELRVECDPVLRPYEVSAPGLESWELIQPDASAPSPSLTLVVRLREPLQAGTLRVLCLAPLDAAGADAPRPPVKLPRSVAWTCPGARLVGAVSRGETLTLRFHPDVRLEDWKPGAFRLGKARTETDGTQVWTLNGGSLEGDKQPQRRPSARVQTQDVEFLARQLTWWQVGPEKASLQVQVSYEVTHGRLFELPLTLPPGWDVDRVEMYPEKEKLLRAWGVRKSDGRSMLIVDLQRPLAPPARAAGSESAVRSALPRLTVRLRPTHAAPSPLTPLPRSGGEGGNSSPLSPAGERGRGEGAEMTFPFPDVVPRGARLLEGGLAVDFDQQLYEAVPVTSAPLGPLEDDGPWGRQTPELYYPYRGKGVQGTLKLRQRPPRVRARCTSEVVLASGRPALSVRLFLHPEVGSTDTVDLTFSAPLTGKWTWRTSRGSNEVRRFERLPAVEAAPRLGALGAGHVLTAAALLSTPPPDERWRLTFARPLREPLTLHGTGALVRSPQPGRWEVPLPTVPDAGPSEGEVKLFLGGADVVQIEPVGLTEARAPAAPEPRGRVPSPWRTFRYAQPPLGLVLRGQALTSDRSSEAAADHALLTSYVEPGGRELHHFRFQLWNWRQQTMPLRLPAGARLLAVRVDGQWVTRLPPARAVEDGAVVELPAPVPEQTGPAAEKAVRLYEVLYAVDGPGWLLWTRLRAEPPGLPVYPLDYRHTWCLPPGLAPLLDGRQRNLPGHPTGHAWERGMLGAWERLPRAGLLERWHAGALALAGDEREDQQEQRMEAAGAALARSPVGSGETLGELIDRLAFDHLKEVGPLVLDAAALEEEGLGPATRLPVGPTLPAGRNGEARPWEGAGLVYVPCRPGPLLTTRRQWESWRSAGQVGPVSESIAEAVAEAAVLGHDSSGRFWSAADWLRRGSGAGRGSPLADPHRSAFAALEADFPWTEWEPVAGAADPSTFWVVRQEIVPGLGVALAAVLCLAFWQVGRGGSRRLAFLLLWLAAGGLAVFWLPVSLHGLAWWPLVAGSVIAFVWYLWSAGKRAPAGPPPEPAAGPGVAAAGVLTLACAAGLTGFAADPPAAAPPTVFLLPSPADAPEKQTVLAPKELLDRLDALARKETAGPRDAVLLSASYQGEVVGGAAEFKAVFQVWCPGGEPVPLTLPLDGVQLQEDILLDGARAYPTAARPPDAGYVIKVKDRGVHTVGVRFRVPVQEQGEERAVRFTAPGLLQNRLTLDVPPGAGFLQALIGQSPARGAQRVSGDAKSGLHLEADLGRLGPPLHRTSPLHVRWRQAGGPPRRPVVQVKEAYLWNLRADASSLTALLRYSVSQAPVTTLTLGLPEGLEVQSLDAAVSGGGVPMRLKDWRVAADKGRRRLVLEFTGPVLGEVQATVQLIPVRPFGATVDLPLPVPQADAAPGPALLAYRQEGIEARIAEARTLTYHAPGRFAEQWQKAGRPEQMPPTRAFEFQRRGGETPLLRLQLAVPPAQVHAAVGVTWRVGPHQAELRATAWLGAHGGELALVEWEVPGVETITGVSGPDVHHWTHTGSRVRVWLRRSLGSTEVQLAGWLPLRPPPKGGPVRFNLPAVRVASVQSQGINVRLVAASDVALGPQEVRGLDPVRVPRPPDQELTYLVTRPDYGGGFQVRPAAVAADVRVLTFVEVRDRQLTFTAKADFQVKHGELRRAVLRLRHWGGEAHLEGTEAGQTEVQVRGPPEDRTWTVRPNQGVTGRYGLTLTGSMPLERAAGGIPVPEVTVERADRLERWLVVGGNDLVLEAAQGLVPVAEPEPRQWPQAWLAEADRLRKAVGQVWRVEAGGAPRLRPRPRAVSSPVQVFLTEQTAAVVDGRHWAHQAVWWLYHDASTDLTVRLPDGARAVGVTIDEVPLPPLQPSPDHLWLPLPAGAGARTVRLRWTYKPGAERLDQPRLDRPRLEGATDGPSLWTVHVPAEYQRGGPDRAEGARPISGAGRDVRRAEAFYRLSAVLAEQGQDRGGADRPQLAAVQRRFYECCRYGAQGLAVAEAQFAADEPRPPGLAGRIEDLHPSNQALAERLQELQQQNKQLAQVHGFEELRARAERQARAGGGTPEPVPASPPLVFFPASAGADGERVAGARGSTLPERGVPHHWYGEADAPAPRLQLTPLRAGQVRRALAGSLLLVVLLLVAWVVSHFPGVLHGVRVFWPEQMALLGCVGWQTLGPNLVVAFLILLGVCARLLALVQGGLTLLRRWKPAAPTGGETGSAP